MSVDNELCLKLLKANFDHEVKEILTEAGYWTTKQVWRPVGDKLDNHGIINNQQVEPVDAFVEKLTNSIDAVLISECLERGIDPTSRDAPETVKHAVAKFIEGKDADPQNLKATDGLQGHWAERGMDVTGVSRRVTVVATGYTPKENNGKGCPTISVIDDGEGQTPKKFPETLLKLGSSNKQKVLFAQGKWGQGGTGVLPCSSEQNHFQIIISKRNPSYWI